jgi:predicted permease
MARVAAPREPQKGVFRFLSSVGNSSFLPVPLSWALWGQEGALACLFYILGNNFFIFTFGVGSLARAGGRKLNWRLMGTTLFHPQSLGCMLGLALGSYRQDMPGWLLFPIAELGQATIPLAMVVTGAILSEVRLGSQANWKLLGWASAIKLLALPAVALLVLKTWQPAALVAGQIMLQAAMPSLASTGIYARRFGGDVAQGAAGSLVTTLLCPLFLPFWMGLL